MTPTRYALFGALTALTLACSNQSWTRRPDEIHRVGPEDPRWGREQIAVLFSGETAAFEISQPRISQVST